MSHNGSGYGVGFLRIKQQEQMTREEFQKTVSERFENTDSGFGNMTQRERILLQIASNVYAGVVKNCSIPDVSPSLPMDFDDWIEKAEKECVIDMDLPQIIWADFFKPRGIYPKHAKRNSNEG